MFIVGAAFYLVVPIVAPDIQQLIANNPLVFRPWPGWTRLYMIAHPFGYGVVFAAVFVGLNNGRTLRPAFEVG